MDSPPLKDGLAGDAIWTYRDEFTLSGRWQAAVVGDAVQEVAFDHMYLNIMGRTELACAFGYRLQHLLRYGLPTAVSDTNSTKVRAGCGR